MYLHTTSTSRDPLMLFIIPTRGLTFSIVMEALAHYKSKRGVRCILKPRAYSGLTHSSLFSPRCARTCKKHLTPRFADLNLTPRTALALKVHNPYIRHETRSPFTPEPFSFQGSGLSECLRPFTSLCIGLASSNIC